MSVTDPRRLYARDFVSIPNFISILRVVAMPFLMWGLAHDCDPMVFGALAVAFVSDAVDGTVARRLGEISDTGRIVDPVADKIALGVSFVSVSYWRELPWGLTGLVLLRDAVIVVIATVVYLRRRTIPSSSRFGQATATVLALSVVVFAARWEAVFPWAYGLSVAFVLLSVGLYGRRTARILSGAEDGVRLGAGLNWIDFLLERFRGR